MTNRFPLRVTAPLAICMLAAAIALIGLARPGPDRPTAAPVADAPAADGAAAPAPTIAIADFAFDGDVTAVAGSVVTVRNDDPFEHTLTAVDGSFDTGLLGGSASTDVTLPSAPGTYAYFCSLHPSMTGSLVVAG